MSDPYDGLLRGGISRATLDAFHVREEAFSWAYPVWDETGAVVSYRHKRHTGTGAKYWWDAAWPRHADLLYGTCLMQQGQPMILCAGERDLWLLHTLGLDACTLLGGENARPPERAVHHIMQAAPSSVIVIYDHDQAGQMGAIRAVRALRHAGLRSHALCLPDEVGEKGDLSDLYRVCEHDRERFVAALWGLELLDMRAEPERQERRTGTSPRVQAGRGTTGLSCYQAFLDANPIAEVVAQVVDLSRSVGNRLVGLCPFHNERTPSFVVFTACDDPHAHCFGCAFHGDVLHFLARWTGQRIAEILTIWEQGGRVTA